MADLYDILQPELGTEHNESMKTRPLIDKYLSRLLSLRLSDLTATEPQSLAQFTQSNLVSIQALSSRSHKSTIAASDQLQSLGTSLPAITTTSKLLKDATPGIDKSFNEFVTIYARSRTANKDDTSILADRRDSLLLSSQSSQIQEILDLPDLLRYAITTAAATTASSTSYNQALDLYGQIKRLKILYPDSHLTASIQGQADEAIQIMVNDLLTSLRAPSLRLPAAIRTIGWLRRIMPSLNSTDMMALQVDKDSTMTFTALGGEYSMDEQPEGLLGALFLNARLSIYLKTTVEGLEPYRDLADQERGLRLQQKASTSNTNQQTRPQTSRRPSAHSSTIAGQQSLNYLKRYIELFRDHSFSTIQMFKNIFPPSQTQSHEHDIPSALASYPLHLVNLLFEQLRLYLPNVTDEAARESLLTQVLYAATSLGRLGADFSIFISQLDLPQSTSNNMHESVKEDEEQEVTTEQVQEEPEWYRIIQKHKVQAARLDALAVGREEKMRKASIDVT